MKENVGGFLWDHDWPAQVQQALRRHCCLFCFFTYNLKKKSNNKNNEQ